MLTKAELQRLRSLREKKHRENLGLFVIDGEKVVGELLATNFPLVEIHETPGWFDSGAGLRRTLPIGPRVHPISEEEMARASHFPTPSTLLALGRIAREPLPAGALNQGLTLALDGVQDAGNVGTL